MNITQIHSGEKPVSAVALFKGEQGTATALHILQGQELKEHMTKVPALLICITGEAIFENEQGMKETLLPGDYVQIEAMVKHWVKAKTDCNLILLK